MTPGDGGYFEPEIGGGAGASGRRSGLVESAPKAANEAEYAAEASSDGRSLEAGAASRPPGWRRAAPALALAAVAVAVYAFWGDRLSFEHLSEHSDRLLAWRDRNFAASLLAFASIYAIAVALSLPGAVWLTIAGGYLFGIWIATPLIVLSATLGATILFLIARSSLGELFRERAGPWLGKLSRGFQRDAASYLLMLRLIPIVPFVVVNLAPAFLGVRLWTFVWTTLLGIAPGAMVFAAIGDGLGDVIAAGEEPSLDVLFTPPLLAPLLGLAALSALPLLLRKRRPARRAPAPGDDA